MKDRKEIEDAVKDEIERGQYSLMNDRLFGYVFGREESRDITAEFLSAELEKEFGHRITGISFMPVLELPVRSDLDQVSRLMARCELGGEEHIFVELQLVNFMESKKFPLICCAMMLDAQPEYDIHPCATVSVLSYGLLEKKSWYSDYHFHNQETGDLLDNGMGIHFLEVPKFTWEAGKPVSSMTKPERWMAFFANCLNDGEKQELSEIEPAIGKAYAAAGDFFRDSGNVRRYIEREIALRLFRAAVLDAEKNGIKLE